jgi:hypothetical protein
MLPSKMLNLFRWAQTPQYPETILETVAISFLSALHSSNHGLRETLGKIQKTIKKLKKIGKKYLQKKTSNNPLKT